MTREYMTKAEYRTHKANLTRAINSDNPVEVLRRVERFIERANATTWPDDWHRWNIALSDAFHQYRQMGLTTFETYQRFERAIRAMA